MRRLIPFEASPVLLEVPNRFRGTCEQLDQRGTAMPTTRAALCEASLAACEGLTRILKRSLLLESRSMPSPVLVDGVIVPITQYCLSLLRMRLRPALEPGWLTNDAFHIVMLGGTNSGKSTVLNILLGRSAAGMNARARFSQYPEAYRLAALGSRFLDAYPSRFEGYARLYDRHPERQEDNALEENGYRPAIAIIDPGRMPGATFAPPATRSAVLWDNPDFSTEEAQRYLSAVLDTLALADLVVMTVTRENYADHRGGLLRAMVCDSGLPLLVVANKLEPGSALIDDIRLKVGGDGITAPRVEPERILALPQVECENEVGCLAELLRCPESDRLRHAVANDITMALDLKRRALRGTLDFLDRRLDDALVPLRHEVELASQWGVLVDKITQREFYDRYRGEYLDGEKYVDFNQTLVKLMDLLEIPGIGPIISGVSKGFKAVSRFLIQSLARGYRALFARRPDQSRRGPELETVARAFECWLEALRAEAQVLAERGQHVAWAKISHTLESPTFLHHFTDALGAAYQQYRERMDHLTTQRARSLYDLIARKPALLNTLRGVKVTLDMGTTALIVSSGGLNWTDAVIGPLVAPLQRLVLEFGLDQYMSTQKSQLKQEQLRALSEVIDLHMALPARELFQVEIDQATLKQAKNNLQTLRSALEDMVPGLRESHS